MGIKKVGMKSISKMSQVCPRQRSWLRSDPMRGGHSWDVLSRARTSLEGPASSKNNVILFLQAFGWLKNFKLFSKYFYKREGGQKFSLQSPFWLSSGLKIRSNFSCTDTFNEHLFTFLLFFSTLFYPRFDFKISCDIQIYCRVAKGTILKVKNYDTYFDVCF